MKKGDIFTGIVQRTEFPDKGIVRICAQNPEGDASENEAAKETGGVSPADAKEAVVRRVLPGQKIRFRVSKVRRNRYEGELLEVLSTAEHEQAPDCPHFGFCGGCTWRQLPYQAQLALKKEQVSRLLEEVYPDPHFEGIKASPRPDGYRNKMEFSFGDAYKDGPLSLGMHKRGSFYDIVTVDRCRIVDEDFRRILTRVLELVASLDLPYYHRVRHAGYLRHLLVRKAAFTGEILVDLITTSSGNWPKESATGEAGLEEKLVETLLRMELDGKITGILHTVNDSISDTITDQGTRVLYGRDDLREELLGLSFKITPFSFFQTNSAGAQVLYEIVREYAGETAGREIFDLYSGTGTIAQILAPVAKHVTGVEIVDEAVEAARENARRNGLKNCTFITGDVLRVVDELQEKPDLIILDPPRDGIHPKALPKILAFGVERIVYISCKPTSLARDLVLFRQAGYELVRSCCVDMFPATGNIETVVLLSR